MRYSEIISEDYEAGTVLFHGTKTTAAAQRIRQKGLIPPVSPGRGKLSPVLGKVYLTPSIQYAAIYALGGAFLGHNMPKEFFEANGAYGYVFVVKREDAVDQQPDEDSIGEFYYNNYQRFKDDKLEKDLSMVMYYLTNAFTTNQRKQIIHGEYAAWASGGKRAVKGMPKRFMDILIANGAHIANHGTVMPFECWRIDKRKSVDLIEDGSNFFEVAKKVWVKGK